MLLVGIVVKLMTDHITPATFGNFTLTLFVLVLSFVRILKKAAAYGATAFCFYLIRKLLDILVRHKCGSIIKEQHLIVVRNIYKLFI